MAWRPLLRVAALGGLRSASLASLFAERVLRLKVFQPWIAPGFPRCSPIPAYRSARQASKVYRARSLSYQ